MFPFGEYPIGTLSVLTNISKHRQDTGDNGYRLFTSGSYTSGGTAPAVPIMIGGSLVSSAGWSLTQHRGGVAVLANGDIKIGRIKFDNSLYTKGEKADFKIADSIQRTFSNTISTAGMHPVSAAIVNAVSPIMGSVIDFMGGGALVVENGAVIDDKDMTDVQKFTEGGNGYGSNQLRDGRERTAIGLTPAGKPYLIITDMKPQVAAAKYKGKYPNLVFFDGGNGFWAHSNRGEHRPPNPNTGYNSTGFGIM